MTIFPQLSDQKSPIKYQETYKELILRKLCIIIGYHNQTKVKYMEFSKKHIFMSACAVLLKFCAQNGVTVYLGINMTVLSIG